MRKKQAGRKVYRHVPTEALRNMIEQMVAFGVTQEEIANLVDLHLNTLRKHYIKQLEQGKVKANLKVAQVAYTMATSGKDGQMTRWWLETRMKESFKKTEELEIKGGDAPVLIEFVIPGKRHAGGPPPEGMFEEGEIVYGTD